MAAMALVQRNTENRKIPNPSLTGQKAPYYHYGSEELRCYMMVLL